ncbi:MAG: rhodanese-like domain-containing protein [Bacteroidota bacterium]
MPRRRFLLLGLGLLVAGAAALWLFRDRLLTLDATEAAVRQAFPEVPTVSTHALSVALRDSARAPLLLDARQPEEYAVSHLPGALQVDPEADAATLLATIGDMANGREVIVYCSVGYRSAKVATRLQEAGLGNVSNLEGSIFRWANEDRPLVRDGQPMRLVHPYNATWGRLLAPERRAPLTRE